MLKRARMLLLTAVNAAGAGCAAGTADSHPAYRADLDGEWVLDAAAGNDSSALALAFADSADPRLRASRGRRRPAGIDLSRDTLGRVGDPVLAARRALAAVREPPARLTIVATDTLVTFGFGGTQDVALRTAWQAAESGWADARSWRVRARWRQGRLEVERQPVPENGVRLREYYSRSPGGDRLVVWTVVELPADELTVRRIYRLSSSGRS